MTAYTVRSVHDSELVTAHPKYKCLKKCPSTWSMSALQRNWTRTACMVHASCEFYIHPEVFVNQSLVSYKLAGYGYQLPPVVTQLPKQKMSQGSNLLKLHQTFNWLIILTNAWSFKKLKSCHYQYPISCLPDDHDVNSCECASGAVAPRMWTLHCIGSLTQQTATERKAF